MLFGDPASYFVLLNMEGAEFYDSKAAGLNTWLGEPLRLVRPWPDLYLDFYPFTSIMDLSDGLHSCK